MIGRFKDNIFVLNKNCDIKDYFKNQFYEIKKDKVILYTKAFAFSNDKIITLDKGEYSKKELVKLLFSDKVNKDSFLNDFVYDDDKFIYIHFFDMKYSECKDFQTSFEEVKKAENFIAEFLDKKFDNPLKEPILLVFNELFFNAYEHGNLGLTFDEKEQLLREKKYMDFLKNAKSNKKINICVSKLHYKDKTYFVCKITDEGEGFDLNQNKTALFNGRGLLMSDRICNGVFYNEKGNSVLFIKEIK